MGGRYIDIELGLERFEGYLATPPDGTGPGVVLLQEIFGITEFLRSTADYLAEEGYVTLVPDLFWRQERRVELTDEGGDLERAYELYQGFDHMLAVGDIEAAADTLRSLDAHAGKVGAVGYCMGGMLAVLAASQGVLDCAGAYYPVGALQHVDALASITAPTVVHLAGDDEFCPPEGQETLSRAVDGNDAVQVYVYPGATHPFANPWRKGYDKPVAQLAYSRTLAVLRSTMGPHFNLSELWDHHQALEFAERDAAATMETMVAEPYVNNVPTMTGGVGHNMLARFYQHHFVDVNPEARVIPVSRTVGSDRVVDEFVSCFTHDREIPWMLPGIPPTNEYVEIAVIAIVCFRGDKLYHEHIYWDHASLLKQLGLIDDALPVAGVEAARKLLDESLPSNALMASWSASEGLPHP